MCVVKLVAGEFKKKVAFLGRSEVVGYLAQPLTGLHRLIDPMEPIMLPPNWTPEDRARVYQ